jgi:hypothetical protein
VLDIEEDNPPPLLTTVFLNPTRPAERHNCQRAAQPRYRLDDAPSEP